MHLRFSWSAAVVTLVAAWVFAPGLVETGEGVLAAVVLAVLVGRFMFVPLKRLLRRKVVLFDVGGVLWEGEWQTEPIRLMRGMRALLERLNSRYVTAIFSNNNELFFLGANSKFGLTGAMDYVVTSSRLGAKKPDARAFRLALEKIRTSAGDVIFVDDDAANVAAAKKVGMHAIQFKNAGQLEEALKARGVSF